MTDVVQYINRPAPFGSIPYQLFQNGEQGAIYLPHPYVRGQHITFQDAAGTIPATEAGDPVGLMLDLSGNGNHVRQEVSGARPTLQRAGGYWHLSFDGVDDALTAGDVMDVGSGSLMQAAAFTRASANSQNAVMGKSWTAGDSGRYFLVTRTVDAFWYDRGDYSIEGLAWQAGRTYVAAQIVNRASSGTHAFRRDGVEESLVAGLPSGSVENNRSFHIGFYPSNYARHMGPFFGGVVVIRENDFTERDVQIVERFLAQISGAEL